MRMTILLIALSLCLAPSTATFGHEGDTQDLFYLTLLVAVEAEGEPYQGKLAVAWVAMNRARKLKQSVVAVILEPREFTGFWVSRRVNKQIFPRAHWAARAAYFALEPDPTHGATHYLNVPLTKTLYGRLPEWYNPQYVTTVIGQHTFLRLY